MIDSQTRGEVRVSTYGAAGSFVMVSIDQLSQARELLDRNRVEYWVDAYAISLDGKPAVAFINLAHSEDANEVQALLDDPA